MACQSWTGIVSSRWRRVFEITFYIILSVSVVMESKIWKNVAIILENQIISGEYILRM